MILAINTGLFSKEFNTMNSASGVKALKNYDSCYKYTSFPANNSTWKSVVMIQKLGKQANSQNQVHRQNNKQAVESRHKFYLHIRKGLQVFNIH